MSGFRVYVGDTAEWNENKPCGNATSIKTAEDKIVACPKGGLGGSYVHVMLPKSSGSLALCEVKIQGEMEGQTEEDLALQKKKTHQSSPITFRVGKDKTASKGIAMKIAKDVAKKKISGVEDHLKSKGNFHSKALAFETLTMEKPVPGRTYRHWKLDLVGGEVNAVVETYVSMSIESQKVLKAPPNPNATGVDEDAKHPHMKLSRSKIVKSKPAQYYDFTVPEAAKLKAKADKLESIAAKLQTADNTKAPGFLSTGGMEYANAKGEAQDALAEAKAAALIVVPHGGMVVALRGSNGNLCAGKDNDSSCRSGSAGFSERLLVVDAGAGYVGFKGGKHLCVKAGKAHECEAAQVSEGNKFKITRLKGGKFSLQHKQTGLYCTAKKHFKCTVFHADEAEAFSATCLNKCGEVTLNADGKRVASSVLPPAELLGETLGGAVTDAGVDEGWLSRATE
jgi:hypothetical protein